MGCFFKYMVWAAIALCAGIMLALLLPIHFIAGVEAIIIVALGICFCFKK